MGYPEERVCLVVVDGFSSPIVRISEDDNKEVYLNKLCTTYPYLEINAGGEDIGCSEDTLGDSRMGHITLGSGRVTESNFMLVENAIKSGEFASKLKQLYYRFTKRIHLVGLFSDNDYYSSLKHCKFINDQLRKDLKNSEVFIHAISDGVDVKACSFKKYYDMFDNVVSVTGRFYAFDNKDEYDRILRTYRMMTSGKQENLYLSKNYNDGITDEYFLPTLLRDQLIYEDDTIIFFNVDGDSFFQLPERFQKSHRNIFTLTMYKKELGFPIFPQGRILNTLTDVLSENYYSQIHISERERFKNITYYFNGKTYYTGYGEQDIAIGNVRRKESEHIPDCEVLEIAYHAAEIISRKTSFVAVEIAGPHVVGHDENFLGTEKSISALDKQIEILHEACIENGYTMIITSSNGNSADLGRLNYSLKYNKTTKVPFLVLSNDYELDKSIKNPSLKDVAPTVLWLFHLTVPAEMTGRHLIKLKY